MARARQGRPTPRPLCLREYLSFPSQYCTVSRKYCLPTLNAGTAVIVNNDSVELFSYFFLDRVPDFSSGVIFKLMSFTFAMITLPIGTYFFTNAYVFSSTVWLTLP